MDSYSHSRLVQLAKEHPVVAGIFFAAIGAFMMHSNISKGTEYAQFIDGISVSGTVVELRGDYSIPAKFEMDAKWKDDRRKSYSGTIKIYKSDFEQLKKGSKIPLLLSKSDHSKAMPAESFARSKPINVAGIWATKLVYVGAAMFLFGCLCVIFGLRR